MIAPENLDEMGRSRISATSPLCYVGGANRTNGVGNMTDEEFADAQASIPAMFVANAAIFRTLMDVFCQNAGSPDEQKKFQQALFANIMRDMEHAPGDERVKEMAKVQVRAIFGLSLEVAKN